MIWKDVKEELEKVSGSVKKLREFALVVGGVFGLIGLLLLRKNNPAGAYLFAGSLVLLIAGLLFPLKLRPLQIAWMTLGLTIGWFVSRIILTVLFLLVITPLGLAGRITGKDFLNLRWKTDTGSFWEKPENSWADPRTYEKQF